MAKLTVNKNDFDSLKSPINTSLLFIIQCKSSTLFKACKKNEKYFQSYIYNYSHIFKVMFDALVIFSAIFTSLHGEELHAAANKSCGGNCCTHTPCYITTTIGISTAPPTGIATAAPPGINDNNYTYKMSTSFYLFNKIGVYRLIILVDSHKTTTIINAHNHHYSKLTKNEEHFQNYVCSSGHIFCNRCFSASWRAWCCSQQRLRWELLHPSILLHHHHHWNHHWLLPPESPLPPLLLPL